jgi:hydrogenase expression/formation protein HypD
MKHIDEYRDPAHIARLAAAIREAATRPWTLMEICGGQTHSVLRFGLDQLLPEEISLIHGPGCPVCVTPAAIIDQAIEVAARPNVILCSFGDMLRVPGARRDLLSAKAAGADVRVVYSPLEALALAEREPQREVVLFGIGFETTAPTTAMAVYQARARGVRNFSLLASHVLASPAMRAILQSADCRVQGFLAAGHVCTIMGWQEYEPLAHEFRTPIIITGFEPVDLLAGILACIRQLEAGRAEVENAYARYVKREGNLAARRIIDEVFEVIDQEWRGLGVIPRSGLGLTNAFRRWDAAERYGLLPPRDEVITECCAGEILTGRRRPHECPAFGTRCTPEAPLGAPMVSAEGACAAYYRYRGVSPAAEGVNRA